MKQLLIDFLRSLGARPAVLGLSGGVDSAVVAYLLAEAIEQSTFMVAFYHLIAMQSVMPLM